MHYLTILTLTWPRVREKTDEKRDNLIALKVKFGASHASVEATNSSIERKIVTCSTDCMLNSELSSNE